MHFFSLLVDFLFILVPWILFNDAFLQTRKDVFLGGSKSSEFLYFFADVNNFIGMGCHFGRRDATVSIQSFMNIGKYERFADIGSIFTSVMCASDAISLNHGHIHLSLFLLVFILFFHY